MAKPRRMDAAEAHVREYLRHCGHEKVDHEPDGNVPPDFLIDDRIAIEVRRLDQNFVIDGKPRGLEVDSTPLWHGIKRLLVSAGPPTTGESWFVWVRCRRPMEDWKTLKPKIRRALETFRSAPNATDEIEVAERLLLRFRLASRVHETAFVMGGMTDLDAGGFIIGELVTNIQLCIADKSAKVTAARPKYPEWWLVLVNKIDNDLDEDDRDQIRGYVKVPDDWQRVIVVNGRDSTRAFDL